MLLIAWLLAICGYDCAFVVQQIIYVYCAFAVLWAVVLCNQAAGSRVRAICCVSDLCLLCVLNSVL
jgi:hypothetical protein